MIILRPIRNGAVDPVGLTTGNPHQLLRKIRAYDYDILYVL
jgi:hypothetical protein